MKKNKEAEYGNSAGNSSNCDFCGTCSGKDDKRQVKR